MISKGTILSTKKSQVVLFYDDVKTTELKKIVSKDTLGIFLSYKKELPELKIKINL